MSIMIIYGNNKSASILTDCRSTCTMPDNSIHYYERACKVRKFNKTIIGIIGDGHYSEKIYESIKNSFNDIRSFVNAKFEDLYELCVTYAKQYKNDFSEMGCMISIAGITKDNQITLDYFHTNDFIFHTITPSSEEYVTKTFCNYNEPNVDQKVYNLVNTTEERLISFQLHNFIIDEILPIDNSVNANYSVETISL